MPRIKVLIADDHAIVREGLKALLDLEDDIQVVGEVSSSMEGMDIVQKLRPEVVLMDIKMPGVSGIEATRLIKEIYPNIKVILLTNYDDEEYVLEAIKCGADGYVLKDIKKGDLPKIIRTVIKGQAFIDASVTHKILDQIKKDKILGRRKVPLHPLLSQRELQILEYLVEGKSNKEIAETVHLSLDTIKTHLKKAYQKLGVHTRPQAIRTAVQQGLVNLSRQN